MAFNFGASAPAPASGAGVSSGAPAGFSSSGGGFSFGATAPAGTAPAPAAPSFGAALATGAPATTNPPTASAPATGASAPTPATGGFNFGGNAPAAPASGFTASATPAPATSGAFGSTTAAPSSNAPAAPATAATVPEFATVFPNIKILSKLEKLLLKASEPSDEGKLAAQELMHVLQCNGPGPDVFGSHLAKPQAPVWKQRDVALRERLKAHPTVTLHGSPASLTSGMLDEIFKLADDLRIQELDAMALYAEASRPETRERLEDRLGTSFVENALSGSVNPLVLGVDVMRASRELYFYEQSCALKALHMVMQYRLEMNPDIIAATDQLLNAGLIENLVALIREWTRQTGELERELSNASAPAPNPFGLLRPSASSDTEQTRFAKVLLASAQSEREMASECLFFLTYQTQCTAAEVASMIDLVKDLTNGTSATTGLPILNPVQDVPSAFQNPTQGNVNPWGAPFTSPLPPLRDKDPVEWEKELVAQAWKGGKPQLLQCVSSLVLSVMCALDSRHELIDRNTHRVNEFGTGNALFPPQSADTQSLLPVHQRLDRNADAGRDWRRKDIWGILVASYALLLRSLPSVANSPRLGSAIPPSPRRQGPIDIKSTWRASMIAPTEEKSFTFARLCMMPSFQRHRDGPDAMCDTYEFFMSVLSEFMAHYLDVLCASGDVPISRAQWERDEERELQLRREQQEQQRQFRTWSGTCGDEDVIPSGVDLMARPDCMDDVMALAIALASSGPDYATFFWATSQDEVDEHLKTTLVPSRALRKLELQQEADRSLLSTYVSFLSVLALAPAPGDDGTASGATLVNKILSRTPPDSGKNSVTWTSIMEAVRWYARELSPGDYNAAKSTADSKSSSAGLAGRDSTAYYYGTEGNGYDGSAGYTSSQQGSSGSTSSTNSKPEELGETNTNMLLSHLGVLANVAVKEPAARSSLVSTNLPIAGQVASSDPLLTVLFLLAIAPLTPVVRGAVFSTIASLLRLDGTSPETGKIIKEHAKKAWELLETCRVLPISLLDQYEPLQQGSASLAQGLIFPPSSLSLVGNGASGAWLPADQKYGILFEMEHVESRSGYYPSTQGFLQLLTSLFISAGSPADLGADSRPRPGCTPYIEYVANFVLPRVLGSDKDKPSLPFRTLGDKFLLVSHGVKVIESVLVRYTVPPPIGQLSVPALVDEKKTQRLRVSEASEMFRLPTLVNEIVVAPHEKDASSFARDYRDSQVVKAGPSTNASSDVQPSSAAAAMQPAPSQIPGGGPPIPSAKSPGFTVLTEILSSATGSLFRALVKVLTDDGGEKGIRGVCGLESYMNRLSQALYGATPPTVSSARSKDTSQSISFASLLDPLLPPIDAFTASRDDAVYWRETSIILTLRILCAAAAREEPFSEACAGQRLLKLVPVLRFQARRVPPASIIVHYVQLSRLVELLISFGGVETQRGVRFEALPAVVQYLQCCASSIEHDAEMASPSLALTYYAGRALGSYDGIRALCGTSTKGVAHFAAAMGKRLSRSCQRAASHVEADIASLILDSILDTFREGCAREISISHVILGLPFMTEDNWIKGTYDNNAHRVSGGGEKTRDCFDAILDRISETEFVLDPSSSSLAVRGFEIVFRLTEDPDGNPAAVRRIGYAAERLRTTHFWAVNLMCLLASRSDGRESILQGVASLPREHRPSGIENVLHCIAWLLKSASAELLPSSHTSNGFGQRRQLFSILFSSPYQLLRNVLQSMPIAKDQIAHVGIQGPELPSKEAVGAARVPMKGATEVVDQYVLVDKAKLLNQIASSERSDQSNDSKQKMMKWADEWNSSTCWDCASSHLAVAALCLVESSMNSTCSGDGQVMGASSEAFEMHQPTDLLISTLSRLLVEGNEGNGHFRMDARLSARVSYNLSRIVALFTEQIAFSNVSSDASSAPVEGSYVGMYSRLALAVTASACTDHGRPLLPLERLRTAIFGLALSVAMKSDPDRENLDGSQVEKALMALASLAISNDSITVHGELRATGTVEQSASALAQLALSSLLDLYRDDESLSVVTVMTAPSFPGGKRSVIQAIVALIARQDDQIYRVVEKIALCQEGPELLLDAHLLQALCKVASNYVREEERARADFRYQNVAFAIPAFFQGHMSLLKTLLISPLVPANRRSQLTAVALDVLLDSTTLMERMFSAFPYEANALVDCLEGFSLATEGENMERLVSDERSFKWDTCVLKLAYQLSQNPFPRRLLPSLPVKLIGSGRNVAVSGHVRVSDVDKDDVSWWDTVEKAASSEIASCSILLPDPPTGKAQGFGLYSSATPFHGFENQWSDWKYDEAVIGAQTLDACLSFITSRMTWKPLLPLDGLAVARGLCRCADAAKAIQFRLRSLETILQTPHNIDGMGIVRSDRDTTPQTRTLEQYYLSKLGPIMRRCSERLLVISSLHLQTLIRLQDGTEGLHSAMINFSEAISAALDHTKIESIGSEETRTVDDKQDIQIAQNIRSEIAKVRK